MRHLLNTLYVFTEDAYLMLDGENVVVRRDGAELGRVPLHTLEGILCFSYRGASPALMGACVERGVGLSFFDRKGRFLAGAYGSFKEKAVSGSKVATTPALARRLMPVSDICNK